MRKHGKFREKGTNFVTGNLEEQNPNAERAARSTKVSLRKVGTREEKGMGAWAAPREDELGKGRYKPEERGLYIDDPHATLKPELQRVQRKWPQGSHTFFSLFSFVAGTTPTAFT